MSQKKKNPLRALRAKCLVTPNVNMTKNMNTINRKQKRRYKDKTGALQMNQLPHKVSYIHPLA